MRSLAAATGIALLSLTALSCESPAATVQSPAPNNQVSGAPSCNAADHQDLVFSGQIAGHVTCSTAPATCSHAWTTPVPPGGLTAPVDALAGKTPIHLTVVFGARNYTPATYVAGDPGEGNSATSNYGVTLDGMGSWVSMLGGSVVMSSIDPTAASGTVDVKLHQRLGGPGSISVTGSWRCSFPAGF
jgi:hypothetical protein